MIKRFFTILLITLFCIFNTNALDVLSVNTNNFTLNRTNFSGSAITLNSLTLTNSLFVSNGSATNMFLDVNGVLYTKYIDPVSDVFTNIITIGDTANTVTVTRAMGNRIGTILTKNTVFQADMSTFPTNAVSSFSLCINPGTYSATFGTGLTNISVSLTANTWHTIYYFRGCFWSKFKGKSEIAP